MIIDHVYERDDVYVVFGAPKSLGLHYQKSSAEAVEIREHLAVHLEALIPEPVYTPSTEELAAIARVAIIAELADIDALSARPIRAIVAGTASDDDRAKLAEIEARAPGLRAKLSK